MIKSLSVGILTGTMVLGAGVGQAQAEYPTKPVTLIVPYGAGGASDLAGRAFANVASKYLPHPMVVTNRTGAGGVTGSNHVLQSDADGYTLLLARVGSQAIGPAMNRTLPYDWDDFTVIGLLEQSPYACAVNADSPYETISDLADALEDGDGSMSYAATGAASGTGFSPVLLMMTLGVDTDAATMIPYDAGEALGALVGGHVDFFCQNVSALRGAVESGQVRMLMTMTEERLPELPDVPAAPEVGLPEMTVVSGWSALYGPPGLSQEVIATWAGILDQVGEDPEWQASLDKLGSMSDIRHADEAREFAEQQFNAYSKVFEELGIVRR